MAKLKLTIKPEHLETVIGFNGSAAPLGQRDDLHKLAIMAQASGDTSLLAVFEGELPTLARLRKFEADKALEKLRPAAAAEETFDGQPDTNPEFKGSDEGQKNDKQPAQPHTPSPDNF